MILKELNTELILDLTDKFEYHFNNEKINFFSCNFSVIKIKNTDNYLVNVRYIYYFHI